MTGVGGGKPFGFGSVRVDVGPVMVQTAAMRYLGEPGAVPDIAEAVTEFRAWVTPGSPRCGQRCGTL